MSEGLPKPYTATMDSTIESLGDHMARYIVYLRWATMAASMLRMRGVKPPTVAVFVNGERQIVSLNWEPDDELWDILEIK